ncbi:Peptide chain release factor 1 [Candidatus Johnevansia muelleri]|uniref:Peptide chain release factor 1 n=1 Tax=Candidatus Johnevansia muelleri TaxID=1495769 RepID=A0A078KBQ8_9GAMM|nr:Peptide chain release factor 1 [Candidatus Evansia muelleri]
MKKLLSINFEIYEKRFKYLSIFIYIYDIINDPILFRKYSIEYYKLKEIIIGCKNYQKCENSMIEINSIKNDDIRNIFIDEIIQINYKIKILYLKLKQVLITKDPNDEKNIFIEVRAGSGGDEAAIFAGDLFRMYVKYIELQCWNIEIISINTGEHGGFKEIIARIEGIGVYGNLKFESGVHRVQRIPTTESQGRIHTSACTVAILVETTLGEIIINPADLRIDTYRSSGAGGQHVNTTNSAIRITHIPTGIVVECQDERSQHKNRSRTMSLLYARIKQYTENVQNKKTSEIRKSLIGSGDRSERIRTYNFAQDRLTDHRINFHINLSDILSGNLYKLINVLINEYKSENF